MPRVWTRRCWRAFGIEDAPQPELSRWIDIMDRYANPEGEVTIGVVGKYVGLKDAYKSLHEALVHGGIANKVKVHISLDRCRAVRAAG
jgi:CTP synthase